MAPLAAEERALAPAMMLAIQCLFAAFYAAREQETARRASQESISRLARRAARLRP